MNNVDTLGLLKKRPDSLKNTSQNENTARTLSHNSLPPSTPQAKVTEQASSHKSPAPKLAEVSASSVSPDKKSSHKLKATLSSVESSSDFSSEKMAKILVDMGVKPAHVNIAIERTKKTGEPLSQIMRDFGFLSTEGVAQAVALQTNFPYFSYDDAMEIDRNSLPDLLISEFKSYIPVGLLDDGTWVIAVPDSSVVNIARNEFYDKKTAIVIASEHTIQTVYRRFYARTQKALDEMIDLFSKSTQAGRRTDDEDQTIGLVRDIYFALLRHACYSGASDLYLYKSEYVGIIRLKINGVGQILRTIDNELFDRLLNRMVQDNTKADELRIRPKESVIEMSDDDKAANPDIANRFNFRLELTESRGIRNAVIRILDKNSAATDLDKLGFDEQTSKALAKVSRRATGFFLVTGPTGSGKSTSLYALLKSIDPVERSIQSIEDPIEYRHGLWQQYELRKDATDKKAEYNEWLKALLRNAPDVILVGEVRDKEVAEVCLNAANTGHLVFATLHTNNAVLAVARLKSLNIDLDVLGSVLLGVLGQRLLRVLCSHCKIEDHSEDTLSTLEVPYINQSKITAYKASTGCEHCDYTGYLGRRAVYELLECNPSVRAALEQNLPPTDIAKAGMDFTRSMWANGLKLIAEGVTSLNELERMVDRD